MEEDSSNQTATILMSPCSEQASTSPPTIPATNNLNSTCTTAPTDTTLSPNGTILSASSISASSSHVSDFVTPLKKRRLARESISLDSGPTSPELVSNSLQSRLSTTPEEQCNENKCNIKNSNTSLSPTKTSPGIIDRIKSEMIPEAVEDMVNDTVDLMPNITPTGEEMVPATVRAVSPDMTLVRMCLRCWPINIGTGLYNDN